MRHYFFDASALVKLYTLESGTERVKDMVRSARHTPFATRVCMSELIHPEVVSALAHLAKSHQAAKHGLGGPGAERTLAKVRDDLGAESSFVIVGVDGLMGRAAGLVWRHRIRGADAVHLAAALTVRASVNPWDEFYFVSADQRQSTAARAEGLWVISPD